MIRRPPRSTLDRSSAASDVYKRQLRQGARGRWKGDSRGAWLVIGKDRCRLRVSAGEFGVVFCYDRPVRRTIRIALLAGWIAAGTGKDARAADGWRVFHSEEGGFRVEMPGEPVASE